MREHPYTGQNNSNDFTGLNPEQASELITSYRHLGDAFEDRDDEGMFGLGFHLDDPLALIKVKYDRSNQARRELVAAVRLARYKGHDWTDIGKVLGMSWIDVMRAFPEIRP